jgi:hypothetical protein
LIFPQMLIRPASDALVRWASLVLRPERTGDDNPAIHYGLIASAN